MKHLNDVELVDVVEHTLPASRARHLDGCEPCRKKVEGLRLALARVAEIEAQEPSPLFWNHFSARVRDAIQEAEAEAAERNARSSWSGAVSGAMQAAETRWLFAGALLTLLLVAGVWRLSAPANPPGTPGGASLAAITEQAGAAEPDLLDEIESDAAWGLVRSVADDVTWNDAVWDDAVTAGVGARPGSAERAVLDLTIAERRELVQLLQAETKRPGA